MSIFKRGETYWVEFVIKGQRIRRSAGTTNRKAAQEYHDKFKSEIWRQSQLGEQPQYIWQDAVKRYLHDHSDKASHKGEIINLRTLSPYLVNCQLEQIDMEALTPFIDDRRTAEIANATINRALALVRRILYLARDEWKWIKIASKIRLLKEPKSRVRWLTRDQAAALIATLPKHLKPVVQFALASGCRCMEILHLEWARVDLERRVAWLDAGTTKNGEARCIPLNDDAMAALRAAAGHKQWCFTYHGEQIKSIGKAYYKALVRVGVPDFRFHDLRHTWASWHVQNGTSLNELMVLGGWKSYSMVLRYAHLDPDRLAEAARRIDTPLHVVSVSADLVETIAVVE